MLEETDNTFGGEYFQQSGDCQEEEPIGCEYLPTTEAIYGIDDAISLAVPAKRRAAEKQQLERPFRHADVCGENMGTHE